MDARSFQRLFDTDFMPRTNATAPAINVKETEHDYTVELAAAGMKKDDFNINIDADGNLHIKMEKKNEKRMRIRRSIICAASSLTLSSSRHFSCLMMSTRRRLQLTSAMVCSQSTFRRLSRTCRRLLARLRLNNR